jgi:hypothetical protein
VGEQTGPPRLAIGCLLLPGSFFGGGMIGVGIAQIVDTVTGCKAASDLPACNTFPYFLGGGILGAVVMIVLIQWRIRRRAGADAGAGLKQSKRS